MSAFEIKITPTRLGNKRSGVHEPTEVIMAPFTAKAIVQFEDVPVTKTAKRVLKVKNLTENDIEVSVTKLVNPEHNVSVEWTEKVVPAQSSVDMVMFWAPHIEVSCKETMQLTDNRNFRKDVVVILKSKSSKSAKTIYKFPTVSSGTGNYVKTLRLKSPKSASQTAKNVVHHRKEPQKLNKPILQHLSKPHGSWNSSTANHHRERIIPKVIVTRSSPLKELNGKPLMVSPSSDCVFKEHISPLTPDNVLNMIDNLEFTPVAGTVTRVKACVRANELASLPTPVSRAPCQDHPSRELEFCPRRLTATDLMESAFLTEELLNDTKSNPTTITNKTFDVKHGDLLDTPVNVLERPIIENCTSTLNVTTTIAASSTARPLEMITEEDVSGSGSVQIFEKTFNKEFEESHGLKRDIKMVGTPLRKHSESMKNLSLKSMLPKIAIQGSMPNLNEMECISALEQNRYFYQGSFQHNESAAAITKRENAQKPLDYSPDASNISQISLISHTELMFNQNEILAQSSRFNLNELGVRSHKKSVELSKPKNMRDCPQFKTTILTSAEMKNYKRRANELCDSPSTDSISSACSSTAVTKTGTTSFLPKRLRIDGDHSFARSKLTNPSSTRVKNWSSTKPKTFKVIKTLSLMKKPNTPGQTKDEAPVKLYDSDLYLTQYINPDPFAATTTCDPYLASTMYLDERAVDQHQIDFKKWLNALVSIPADLDADCNAQIDVGKLFNEVRHKELTLAPTKEEQSMNYLTKFRLESLRRAAVELFLSEEMRVPCSKVSVYVNKSAIRIRNDRNLHLDLVMQRYILQLLLCFNPLWLRLGLEVVYGEKINLSSNNDVAGLTTFILNRLFRDRCLEKKYSKPYMLSESYADHIKKFTLQKILFLLLFLDKAKSQRIIKHNPCLFLKNSPHKETKEILLKFSSELLANIGDVTRELRRLGYVLEHKQTYLDEFDYAFNNLATDLRDGIRLTRVMEIILLRDDLTKQLRVPAVSRLQRIFNVNLALHALDEANFQLKGEITAANIVDGHREKTLSLLWQVIYKFRSPKFHAAATAIQSWWRHSWLRVLIRRRIRHKKIVQQEAAATKIQAVYRGFVARKFVKDYKEKCTKAAIVLQKNVRRFLAQKKVLKLLSAIVLIQHWYRAQILGKICRHQFITLRNSTVIIQRFVRRRLLSKKLLQLAEQAKIIHQQKMRAAVCIQIYWRRYHMMKRLREQYLALRENVIKVQRRYRAKKLMVEQFCKYRRLRMTAVSVQRRFRANKLMKDQRSQYLRLRKSVISIQRWWRISLHMLRNRQKAAICIQSHWRCYRKTKCLREQFLELKENVVRIQHRFRAKLKMREHRSEYQHLLRTTIALQRRLRAKRLMHTQIVQYQRLRMAAIAIQRRFRSNKLMAVQRSQFLLLRLATITLQQRFRANKLMAVQRSQFLRLRMVTIAVQRRFRARKSMMIQKILYQRLRMVTIAVQRRFRAKKLMVWQSAQYQRLRMAAIAIQRRFRSNKFMAVQRSQFLRLRIATIAVQERFRAKNLTAVQHSKYQRLRMATITVQRRFRANKLMAAQRSKFLRLRRATIAVQRRFRANKLMTMHRTQYLRLRHCAISMQRRRRAVLSMRALRTEYLQIRAAVLKIQTHFRARYAMKVQRAEYCRIRELVCSLQSRYRARMAMQHQREAYQHARKAIIWMQRKWRSTLTARRVRKEFVYLRSNVVAMQRRYRATRAMRIEHSFYKRLKAAAVCIQRRCRATLQMRLQRAEFLRRRVAAITLQRAFRVHLRVQRMRRYRALWLMTKARSQYLRMRKSAVCIQQKFRAYREMKARRSEFVLLRRVTIHLQQKWRGRATMLQQREQFLLLRHATLGFQARVRGFLARNRFQALMPQEMGEHLRLKKAAKIVQRFWRGYRVRKAQGNLHIIRIRKNIAALRQTSSATNCVRSQLTDAVRILRGSYSVSEALNLLSRLERLSHTVPHLLMQHSGFISTFCYGIMAQAIRSEIDKQLIEKCSRTILNLARYNSTTANTFQKDGLVTIAQMLLRWCDKDCDIFNTLCTLVWVFAHCPQKRKIIREFMTTPEALYVVRETNKLVARKEKMKHNVRKVVVPQGKFPWNALPCLEPDYGIVRNKPYIFVSSVYAFEVVLSKLGIEIF